MAIFERSKREVISEKELANLSRASLNKNLSAVDFNETDKYFYITVDRILFSNPVDTIKTVLEAHGFVPNLENILSCLDSFVFGVHATIPESSGEEDEAANVSEYFPCIRFELPQKNKVGEILQSFYDELSNFDTRVKDPAKRSASNNPDTKKIRDLMAEIEKLKKENRNLSKQVNDLTLQLNREQKSLTRASRAMDLQRLLPENTNICRVDRIQLKRRLVEMKSGRRVFPVPTHMLDRVPELHARCLVTFDELDEEPTGIIFFDKKEYDNLEKRVADLLYVEGNSFKARDSFRNEFQIEALNDIESDTIKQLHRGMKIVISIADDYVVRFSVVTSLSPDYFNNRIQEQYLVHSLARNQLVDRASGLVKGMPN